MGYIEINEPGPPIKKGVWTAVGKERPNRCKSNFLRYLPSQYRSRATDWPLLTKLCNHKRL